MQTFPLHSICASRAAYIGPVLPVPVSLEAMYAHSKYAHSKNLLRATFIVSALMPATLAAAADLPLPPLAPAWTWTGFYVGGSAGAAAGTATFSDPLGPSVFGDKVNTTALLAGLQVGYNWHGATLSWAFRPTPAIWIPTAVSPACNPRRQLSARIARYRRACSRASPAVSAFLSTRWAIRSSMARGGGAWMDSDISITPNNSNISGAPEPDGDPSSRSKAWGWTVGAGIEHALTPAWSVGLEYDYYRFASSNVSTAATISSTGGATPIFGTLAGGTASVTPDIQVVKLALNYHWDQDPRKTWVDAPVFGVAVMPVKAGPAPILQGWEVDAGTRYWYSSGTERSTERHGQPRVAAHLQQSDRTVRRIVRPRGHTIAVVRERLCRHRRDHRR